MSPPHYVTEFLQCIDVAHHFHTMGQGSPFVFTINRRFPHFGIIGERNKMPSLKPLCHTQKEIIFWLYINITSCWLFLSDELHILRSNNISTVEQNIMRNVWWDQKLPRQNRLESFFYTSSRHRTRCGAADVADDVHTKGSANLEHSYDAFAHSSDGTPISPGSGK